MTVFVMGPTIARCSGVTAGALVVKTPFSIQAVIDGYQRKLRLLTHLVKK
jgi:hypothetical protein